MTANVFNYDKTDYERPQLLMGQKQGLFDTVNKHYPEIWNSTKRRNRWIGTRTSLTTALAMPSLKSCSKSTYDMMIKTLAWQWEADLVASRAIAPVLAPFITSSELWAAWQRISDNEVVHAAIYSEIIAQQL